MITIEKLAAFGADTETGLKRCMNNEAFYLRLVNMELGDANFTKLRDAIDARDAHGVFEAAHALKGALGNLSHTPLFEAASSLTELTRNADTPPDVSSISHSLFAKYEELKQLARI